MRAWSCRGTVVSFALGLSACTGFPGAAAPVTPQRPTLSSDAATTAKGTIEVEAGAVIDPGDAWAAVTTTKFGAADATEVFASWSPWIHVDPASDGSGDLALGVRQRVLDAAADQPAVALQFTAKLPTGGSEVSTGETDLFAAGIVSQRFGGLAGTAYYQLGLLGDPAGRGVELQHDLALALALGLGERWGMFGELAATFVPDRGQDAIYATGGATFAPSPGLVFDAGLAVGLSADAPDLVVLIGCTHNLGQVRRWFD